MKEELEEAIDELARWWDSETEAFRELVLRALAALPGGGELQDMGYEPLPIGWKEAELLGRLLLALEDRSDVDRAVRALLSDTWRD